MDSITLQAILNELWPELPELLGDSWTTLEPMLTNYRHQLTAGEIEPALALAYILRALQPYPAALDRLRELTVEDLPNTTRSVKGIGESDGTESQEQSGSLESSRATHQLQGNAQVPETPPATERHISAWVSERPAESAEPLWIGEIYTLNFKVGQPVQASLISTPEAVIPTADVPEEGLPTDWVVISRSTELVPITADTTVTTDTIEGITLWMARFSLRIPKEHDSATVQLKITPRHSEEAELEILVYVRQELYRQFSVRLYVAAEEAPHPPAVNAAEIHSDLLHTPTAHASLMTTHEWTTPPGETSIYVGKQVTFVNGDEGARFLKQPIQWTDNPPLVAGPIKTVRATAERFRARWEEYLDDIDPDDLTQKLSQWTPEYPWTPLRDFADSTHQNAWDEVKTSSELCETWPSMGTNCMRRFSHPTQTSENGLTRSLRGTASIFSGRQAAVRTGSPMCRGA